MTMIGKILIEDYKIHCIVGAHPHERKTEQELALDLQVEFDMTQCVLSDSIADSINYEDLVSMCRTLAQERQYHLLETFAYEVLNDLFSTFPTLRAAKVRVKKKSALALAAYAIIELERREVD